MSDLYDNAWTNAYEELEDNMEEKDIIQKLLNIFKVDNICKISKILLQMLFNYFIICGIFLKNDYNMIARESV